MNQIKVDREESTKLWDWPLQSHDELVSIYDGRDRWEVGLDTGFFTPNEIEVNRMGQNLFIHCKHDEREGELLGGKTTREVKRSYKLPDDVDAKSIRSNITRAGILRITAQKKR
ncbi:hypothetical protein niasHS_017270 [Heterodera schachtii]|uniref:SHSP domain-containing protein n=2 Tax=Heterodera TaxID=34509 RepID=A0ABD2KX01_9BILA